MRKLHVILCALGSIAFAGCGNEEQALQTLVVSVSHEDRVELLDVISSLSHLAQRTEVVLSHPKLSSRLFIASGQLGELWLVGGDPVVSGNSNRRFHAASR